MRFFWSVVSISIGSSIGYYFSGSILAFLVRPLHQKIYYTSPTGGFELVFQVSFLFGVITAAPIIVYHILRFLEPAMPKSSEKKIVGFLIASWFCMLAGVSVAYYVSLPAALNFLQSFGTGTITSLISTNDYFSFVSRYLLGFAALFQLPIIMLAINAITRLRPRMLLSYLRVVILVSFILAAIITPTPDMVNQTIMALPIILLYLLSIIVIWAVNSSKPQKAPAIVSE